jgi:DNA-binding HxlR family transcriptional regulator
MIKSIEKDINKEDYQLKIKNNQVKILPTNPDSYRKLIKLLKTLNAKFLTYQLKQERAFRVVLRNIHHSANSDELKYELQNLGHEVTKISNIRHRITKKPTISILCCIKAKAKQQRNI